jgi:nucleoside 2-deoxyribosyltransferase
MKIYLAGPDVFLQDPVSYGNSLKALCISVDPSIAGLFPLDNAIPAHLGFTATDAAKAAYIRSANMAMIHECDAVVANMIPFRGPSMDVGTAYEMGVGAALGKIVVGYAGDGPQGKAKEAPYIEKVRRHCGEANVARRQDGRLMDHEGWAVEEFDGLGDNLMVSCGADKMCGSVEEAIRAAWEIFEGRAKGKDGNS